MPNLVGGSADLAPSNNTALPEHGDFTVKTPKGRTLHFGVREHGMAAAVNGMALYGGLRPFCATFFVFSDYLKPSSPARGPHEAPGDLRPHARLHLRGRRRPDPRAHRAPRFHTEHPERHGPQARRRPGNRPRLGPGAQAKPTGPTALILTRQNLEVYPKADADWKNTAAKGAYVAKDCDGKPDVVVAATGSEVSLAVKAAEAVKGKKVRVVSILSRERFYAQDKAFRDKLLPPGTRTIVAELGVSYGWEGIASSKEDLFTVDDFGMSGPGQKIADALGRNQEALEKLIAK